MDIYATSILQAVVVLAAAMLVRWLLVVGGDWGRPRWQSGAKQPRSKQPRPDLGVPFVALALVVVVAGRADVVHATLAWLFVASYLLALAVAGLGARPFWRGLALAPALLALAGMIVLLWRALF